MDKRYSISDAARQVKVEAHVLRYWEEELGLTIPRNGQGHRYYRESDLRILHGIQELKEQGFQLRAIKMILPEMDRIEKMSSQELYCLREELNQQAQIEEEQRQRKAHMAQVMPMPSSKLSSSKKHAVSSMEQTQKLQQFEAMMRGMIGEVMEEMQEASEQRICEAVSERMVKEMDYLMREKEELQQKQVELLQQIVIELRPDKREVAVSADPEIKTLQSKKQDKSSGKKRKKFRLGF